MLNVTVSSTNLTIGQHEFDEAWIFGSACTSVLIGTCCAVINGVTLCVMLKYRKKLKGKGYLWLRSLAAASSLFGLSTLATNGAANLISNQLNGPRVLCQLRQTPLFVSTLMYETMLAACTVDRVYALCYPLSYTNLNPAYMSRACIALWICIGCTCALNVLPWDMMVVARCSENAAFSSIANIVQAAWTYTFAGLLLTACLLLVIFLLKIQPPRCAKTMTPTSSAAVLSQSSISSIPATTQGTYPSASSLNTPQPITLIHILQRHQKRLARLILGHVCVSLLLCVAPQLARITLMGDKLDHKCRPVLNAITSNLTVLSATVTAVIYASKSRDFGVAWKEYVMSKTSAVCCTKPTKRALNTVIPIQVLPPILVQKNLPLPKEVLEVSSLG